MSDYAKSYAFLEDMPFDSSVNNCIDCGRKSSGIPGMDRCSGCYRRTLGYQEPTIKQKNLCGKLNIKLTEKDDLYSVQKKISERLKVMK